MLVAQGEEKEENIQEKLNILCYLQIRKPL
jgi:hypothetical protein